MFASEILRAHVDLPRDQTGKTKGTWLARISNPVQVALLLGSDKSAVTVNSVI